MRYPKTHRSVVVLLFVILLIGCGGLIVLSAPAAAQRPGGSPLRLRLKVERTSLSEGTTMNVWADFLDGNYNQVLNDGTRAVKFEIGESRGAGSISPPQPVTVKPGEKSAFAKFTSERAGRILIRASSVGLDSDETFVLITPKPASFLTQILGLFEPVAYAQDSEEFGFLPTKPTKTQIGSQAKFQISFPGTLPADSRIRISTNPPATINYDGKDFDGFKDITVNGKDGGVSSDIYITSEEVGEVKVLAAVQPDGPKARATATFSAISPHRIIFDGDLRDIPSTQTAIPISIHLADEKGRPIQSDVTRSITLTPANENEQVKFESQSVVFSPNQQSAGTMLHLKAVPRGNQLTLLAVSQGDNVWITGEKTIFFKGPIEVMLYWLVLAALAGGLTGGVVRHIPKDYKLKRVLPKWTGECWDLGLVGRIAGSVVCGLFLYLAIKLGLSRMIGSPVLPAGIDLGATWVAFFFGGIGGFAGTVVFDRLVSGCLPGPQSAKKAAVPPGAKQLART
jgi:hypothetical protein